MIHPVIGRALVVLARFPAHLDATRPGKRLGVVADAVAAGLDDLAASLAGVRRAHRIGHADTTADVVRHAALHRIGAAEFGPVDRRLLVVRAAADALTDAADAAARDAAAELVCDLLGVAGPAPRLALFAPAPPPGAPPGPPDFDAAATALAAAARALTGEAGRREAYRARVLATARIHARGNATVRALLEAAASALDLEPDPLRGRAFAAALRPTATVTPQGGPGTTRYAYVVIARSASKNVDRQSTVVTTTAGAAALDAATANLVAWTRPPDARDFLVFRVANGADPAAVGLLTPVALDAATTSFADEGQAPTAGLPPAADAPDDGLFHSRDRFWHALFARARAPLAPPNAPPGAGPNDADVVGMEENPVRRESTPEAPRTHAELFRVYRRGFGRSLLQLRMTGVGNRTRGPMLVNRDEGRGVGFAGPVPDGEALVIDEAGRATLGGADVTAQAFAWTGACYAGDDDSPAAPHDFVFDGPGADPARRATFAVATPFDALDGAFAFPHAGDPLPVPGVGVGQTRYAFFVQQAHFSDAGPPPRPLAPRTHVGFLDGAVFAPPPAAEQAPAATVSLSWLEHEAYALRVLLPRRFSLYDLPGEAPMAELVARALERHRPAGVEVRVEYVDDRWTLGASDVAAAAGADPILSLRGGSVLWPAPAPP